MPIRSSRPSSSAVPALGLAALLPLAAAVACARGPVRTAETAPTAGSSGVPFDPLSPPPRPTDRATAGEGVATLRAPVSTERVMALVRRVFEAFHARDPSLLQADLDENILVDRGNGESPTPRGMLLFEWSQRMRGIQAYEQLEVEAMYRPQDVEIWAPEELGLAGRPSRPPSMGDGDLLVRVPVATPRVGADILFGEEIRLLLRRDGGRYRLRGYGEVLPR